MAMAMAMAMVPMVPMVPMGLERVGRAPGSGPHRLRSAVDRSPFDCAENCWWQRNSGPTLLLGVALVSVAIPADAANWRITPSLAVNETLTNNVFLSSKNPTSDSVTGISPGISIDGKGNRASLRLNYALTQNLYARESASNNHQNALSAIGSIEAIEDFFFIDATGTISQQYISAFGPVSPSLANVDNNRTETSYYSLSPYIKGRVHTWAEYVVRYTATTSDSRSNAVPSQQTSQWVGALNGTTRWSRLTWGLDANSSYSEYGSGRNYDSSSYGVRLSYRFNPQFQFSLLGGQESNDYVSVQQQRNFTRGFGVDWTPGPRTRLAANVRNRFFGTGYDVNFSHRRPRSLVTFQASRDVSSQPAGVSNTGQGNNYDAFYSLIAASNPGLAPDAIRAQVIQVLQSRGLPADGTVVNGYLTDREQLSEQQQLSVALLGVRNTVTFTASQNVQQPLGLINGATDNYSLSNRIRQQGIGIAWGYQLTGMSSLSLSLNQQRSTGYTAGSPETETQYANLLFTTRVGPRTSANVGVRRVISSGVSSYTESALTGSIFHSF